MLSATTQKSLSESTSLSQARHAVPQRHAEQFRSSVDNAKISQSSNLHTQAQALPQPTSPSVFNHRQQITPMHHSQRAQTDAQANQSRGETQTDTPNPIAQGFGQAVAVVASPILSLTGSVLGDKGMEMLAKPLFKVASPLINLGMDPLSDISADFLGKKGSSLGSFLGPIFDQMSQSEGGTAAARGLARAALTEPSIQQLYTNIAERMTENPESAKQYDLLLRHMLGSDASSSAFGLIASDAIKNPQVLDWTGDFNEMLKRQPHGDRMQKLWADLLIDARFGDQIEADPAFKNAIEQSLLSPQGLEVLSDFYTQSAKSGQQGQDALVAVYDAAYAKTGRLPNSPQGEQIIQQLIRQSTLS